MGISTVMKDEVRDILVAVRLAADATAAATGNPYECQAFLEGYYAALGAVAAALGLALPLTSAGLPPAESWIQAPKRYPTLDARDWSARNSG